MKINKVFNQTLLLLMLGSVATTSFVGCSSDNDASKNTATKAVHNPFDHSHDETVTDMVKHKFEHQFADECVAREIRNSNNPDNDKARFEKPCLCIAQYLMKDLTTKEAELFLSEHRNTQSLLIRYDNAAYHCLQNASSQPKSPQLFGKH